MINLEPISKKIQERMFEKMRVLGRTSKAVPNKGKNGEYPFHFDDPVMIEKFFSTLQFNYIEVFHPFLITTRAYKPLIN